MTEFLFRLPTTFLILCLRFRLAEEDHKRPLSPIERIKSLFGASNKAGKAKDHRDRNRDSNVAPGA